MTDCRKSHTRFRLVYQNHRSWMTLNGQNALWCRKDASFGAHCTNLNEDKPIIAATKMYANDSSMWKYKVYADIRGDSSWRGPEMRVGLSTTAILGDLSGYFFANFRDKASNIIWRYDTPCWPVTDCKMIDIEWPLVAISCQNPFSASTSWLRAFDFQKIIAWKVTNMDPCYQGRNIGQWL